MVNLSVFQFESNDVRFVDGKPVANDVARILGYSDPAKTISTKVKDKNKGVTKLVTPGGVQSVTVLEEAGIYQLIFGSKLPSAEKFQDWIFEEVLPAIRKTGTYSLPTAEQTKPGCLLAYEERVLQLPQNLKVPYGYWAVLKQSAYLLLHVEQVLNCPVDRADLLDGSIGKMWASWRKDKEWAKPVKTGSYKYPDGRWCEPNCYEWSELGYFSEFIEGTYTPIHLPRYLEKKYPGIVKV